MCQLTYSISPDVREQCQENGFSPVVCNPQWEELGSVTHLLTSVTQYLWHLKTLCFHVFPTLVCGRVIWLSCHLLKSSSGGFLRFSVWPVVSFLPSTPSVPFWTCLLLWPADSFKNHVLTWCWLPKEIRGPQRRPGCPPLPIAIILLHSKQINP